MISSVAVHRDTYVDSVVQLSGTRAMRAVDGVEWASAAMATPGALATLADEGFDPPDAGVNDLLVAVRAGSRETVAAARDAADAAMFAARGGVAPAEQPPRTLEEAVARMPGANVAVVPVPGEYAALEAHKALSAGLDVLLFSDNVPVAAEVALKERARPPGPARDGARRGHRDARQDGPGVRQRLERRRHERLIRRTWSGSGSPSATPAAS